MKVGEILRKIADIIDQDEAEKASQEMMQQAQQSIDQANAMAQQAANQAMAKSVDLAPEPEEVQVDNTDCTDTETMVPPLQQKHELLKMATNVENNVDDFAETDTDLEELELLKKMAGIGEPQQGPTDYAEAIRPVEINPRKNAALMHHRSDDYSNE